MSSQILLSGGDKWYSYSGEIFGDVSVPATIPMITIDNTGLRDSMVQIQFYTGQDITTAGPDGIGVLVKLDDISIYNSQSGVIGRRDSLRVENMKHSRK